MKSEPIKSQYYISLGKTKRKVSPEKSELAKEIDKNKDKVLSDKELVSYLSQERVDVLRSTKKAQVDKDRVLNEYKYFLQNKVTPSVKYYSSYEQISQKLRELSTKYPDKARLYSLGKSYEGREVWALKVSSGVQGDTSQKPGVVITGATHAREWATAEITLNLANQLLQGYEQDPAMKKRIDGSEIWLVPAVNPDGLTYSHTQSSMWRKNRRPIEKTACDLPHQKPSAKSAKPVKPEPKEIKGVGVDLNRNYYDGDPDHFYLYRPPGDDPCNIWDDFSATSDYPKSDTYRGPQGASESEVKALIDLELKHHNIKGVIDFHSYGQMILYPWGHSNQPAENVQTYKELGGKIKAAMKSNYRLMQSCDLYPASGTSEDMQHINKRLSFTIEVGNSFQPIESDLKKVVADGTAASLVFIDHFLGA